MKTIPTLVLIVSVTILILSSNCSCVEVNDIIPAPVHFFSSKEGEYSKVQNNKKQDNDNKAVNFKSRIQFILPGTKWCGDGNVSQSPDGLGMFYQSDSCCREHDNCNLNIGKGESKYGLNNTKPYTLSHCDCDRKFYECLKRATDFLAKYIGFVYFNILVPQCFKQDYRIVSCLKKDCDKYSYGCVDYKLDTTSKKIYQWFDNPLFSKKSCSLTRKLQKMFSRIGYITSSMINIIDKIISLSDW